MLLTADELKEYEQYFAIYRTLPVDVMGKLFSMAAASLSEPAADVPVPKTRVKKGAE